MTITRFKAIATKTSNVFWPAVFQGLEPPEATYLRETPSARRNLDRRILRALAETLLTPEQISQYLELELEDLQSDLQETPK